MTKEDVELLKRVRDRLDELTVEEKAPGALVQDMNDNALVAELDVLICREEKAK